MTTGSDKIINCIKCRRNGRVGEESGWEKIVDNSDCINNPEGSAKIYWLCPSCIGEFEYCKQLKEEQAPLMEFYVKVMNIFNGLGNLIDKAKKEGIRKE